MAGSKRVSPGFLGHSRSLIPKSRSKRRPDVIASGGDHYKEKRKTAPEKALPLRNGRSGPETGRLREGEV